MISSVFLSGRLGKPLDGSTRYVDLDSVVPGPTGEFRTHHIPVRTSRGESCLFMKGKQGSPITLQGRLESDPSIGLYVKLELEELHPLAE